jgi:DNA-binding NarL/FixJ family response regulator
VSDVGVLLADAAAALGRGDGAAAEALCRQCLELGDHGGAHELLGGLAYAEDRLEDARVSLEAGFRAYEAVGELCRAARVATLLGELHWGGLGNEATGRGWLARSRRLLEDVGPCVEWGYWELAQLACDRPDVDALTVSAARALELASVHGDRALSVRALSDGGLASISRGRVDDGLRSLDEALALIGSGEVTDPFVVSTSFCAFLSAAERVGDAARVGEWVAAIDALVLEPMGGRPRVLGAHCRIAFGGVLVGCGRWPEAEEALRSALDQRSLRTAHRVDALARLAALRLEQGRVDDAAELLAPFEDQVAVAGPLAVVHLRRGDPAVAAAVATRAVEQLVGDVLRQAPLLATLVDAQLATGDVDAAARSVDRLTAVTDGVDCQSVAGLTQLARGGVELAAGRPAEAAACLQEAAHVFAAHDRPALAARANLDLSEAVAATGDEAGAVVAARAAWAAASRLGAAPLEDRAAARLRALGVARPRSSGAAGAALGDLTEREQDVLDGIRSGDTNAQIAARLYLSPKTVEHHVSRVLSKLGVRSRAEAAAIAAVADRDPSAG